MKLIESLDSIGDALSAGSAVAIGKFDGVHIGHREILRRLRAHARANGVPSVVFTFAENPLALLRPDQCPPALMSRAQRVEAIERCGIDVCVMIDFTLDVAETSAENFVRDVLLGQLHAQVVLLGENFRFGHRGAGTAALLQDMGSQLGFTVEVAPPVVDRAKEGSRPSDRLMTAPLHLDGSPANDVISSSRIRQALREGRVEDASRMLGAMHAVRGLVVDGDKRGRGLGFPTANLGGELEGFVPGDGVYAGEVIGGVRGETCWRRPASISVGNNPVFTPDASARVEAYLLDFDGDLYGQTIEVRFSQRLRGMEAFASIEMLLKEMHRDVERTRANYQPTPWC